MINFSKIKIPELIQFKESSEEQPLRGELFNVEQLAHYAQVLASDQQKICEDGEDFLLEKLNYNDTVLRDYNRLILAVKRPRNITPAAEWLVDNFYLIEEHIQLARRHFSKKYSRQLPILYKGQSKGLPRIYEIVLELISHTDAQIDVESLYAFFKAYQTDSTLKLGELWAIPIMLRLALIENLYRIVSRLKVNQAHRDMANLWVDKLQHMAGTSPSKLVEILADMAKSDIPLSSAFVFEFCQRLSSQNPMLHMARSWLEQRLAESGLSIEELIHDESQDQAANQLSVSHSIGSLRFLGTTDWQIFVEKLSIVDRTLRNDPEGTYCIMDFPTRDRYRHVIEELARRSPFSEVEVAQKAIKLAKDAFVQKLDKRNAHVGFYLIGDGKASLMKEAKVKSSFGTVVENSIHRFPLVFYVGFITLFTLFGTFGFVKILQSLGNFVVDWESITLVIIFLFCVSQLALALVNWIAMLIVSPNLIPRLDFSEGVSSNCRTIVVVPTMLSNKDSVDKLIENMELCFLSNRDRYLHFALLTDFNDAANEVMPMDDFLLERARFRVERLNKKYAAGCNNVFFLFHRPRRWNPGEGKWMGFERKRGKLMELNSFLRGGSTDAFSLIEGETSILASVKYVITLDTDTQLPWGSARKLIGAMAHPLNRPEFDPKHNVVVKGYGILQPRIAVSLVSSRYSLYVRLFSGDAGIDPYTRVVSDVYQDIFCEGSFIGKGIYDVDAFEQALAGRFPQNRILSHDLLESTYVRSGLISDIEMYESYPSGYNMDANRHYRWIRGDWQIARWLMPRVPVSGKKKERNPISGLAKFKIFDNLRRSLVSPALLLLLTGFCLFFPQSTWIGPLLVLIIAALPIIIGMSISVFRKSIDQSWSLHLREVFQNGERQLGQVLLSLALLPYDAFLCTNAVLRTLFRLILSHKHLMQWQNSIDAQRTANNSLLGYYTLMWFAPVFAMIGGVLLSFLQPATLPYSLPVLLVWFTAPYFVWWISCPIKLHIPELSSEQTLLLHRIARKTWHFFETFVNAQESWLPPDNFQEIPVPTIASRTSPTNIGLSLLANLAAFDYGYLPAGKVMERTNQTFATMGKLKKYRGHLFNWYNTRTLEPLSPLYVSSVDSGNLAGHLLALSQGLKELREAPIYSPDIFAGLIDTVRVLKQLAGKNVALQQLERELENTPPNTVQAAYNLLKSIASQINNIISSLDSSNVELQTWGQTLKLNYEEHLEELLALAPWVEIDYLLHKVSLSESIEMILTKFEIFDKVPTLSEVARFEKTICPLLETELIKLSEVNDLSRKEETDFVSILLHCLHKAARHAIQRKQMLKSIIHQSENFARMDFTFLFDASKKLFLIGYNVTEQRADAGCYDLLASEARLCSYVAIAQGQVPQEHWFSLNRLLIVSKGQPALLSWSGSMFEYLMPLLVMPSFDNTLLDQTCKTAVQEQIEYGKKLGVPWGMSESGYNRTDVHLNYQYRAFGVPSLGLKRGLSEDLVIAPYATVMALMVAPRKACENMQRLSAEGKESTYGYYEAIDYTPSHLRPHVSSENICSFMAHHQGMSLLSLVNLMKGGSMQRRFMSCPMLKAAELLLQERIPQSVTASVIPDDSKFELEGLHPLLVDSSEIMRIFKDTTIDPEVHLLSNGRYHVMVNNAGGGYSRWNNLAVTRWREDATSDNLGMFVYLRDSDTGEFWSTAYQPTLRTIKGYEAIFTQAYAEFRQRQSGLEVHTTICVSPEDDIELRRIKLTNHSHVPRNIELTTYSEVVIAPQGADEAHPVFSNLFVQTEFAPSSSSIFCTRRARSQEETVPHLLHLMLVQGEQQGSLSCETDRSRFVGRGRSLANPLAMRSTGDLSGCTGSVLDPIISLRRTVTIQPGKSVTLYIALGMAETRGSILALSDKYQNTRMVDRAFELAWTHSQVVLHQLNVTETEAQSYSKLASSLIYANPLLRAAQGVLKSNRRGQNALWGYSISGDVPLVLLRISDAKGLDLVRQISLAHAYWRMKGITVELIILNEDVSVYRQFIYDEIINLISSGIEAPLLEKPGGIFIRRIEQVPREDVLLLQATARIVLDDKQGMLAEQLETLKIPELMVPTLIPSRTALPEILEPLQTRDLIFTNGLGGFTRDGHEYVITLQPGQTTPAPWCNVLANNQFGTVISESGGSYTWAENSHEFRLTPWNNDPVEDPSGEAFYIRDEQTGQFWSPTPLPARGATPYVIRHGFGYTVFEHSEFGIDSELWIYVAMDAPVKFAVLKLYNKSGRSRRLSVTGYYEWVLANMRQKSLLHVQTEIDVKTGALFARNFYNPDFAGRVAFVDVGEARTLSGDRKEFIGQNGNLSHPAAMKHTRLSGKVGAGLDPCGAVQVVFDLADGQDRETRFRLGFANNKEEMRQLVLRFQKTGATREALEEVWAYWNHTLGTINVDTPDPSVNVMANGWLLYQTLSSRIWARSGFYQSGGAYGFRDQLQDVMALVHAEPAITRKQILRAAAHQFHEGDVQHWWHPPLGRGVRTHFSDDYLWLPYVTCKYVSCVADTGILDEIIPFIEGRTLRSDEESYYDMPGRSDESATLYEHCVRSIKNGLRFGSHGLPLIGCGDWNDGMNLIGKEGRGESVWLAFFLYDVLTKFSKIAILRNDNDFAESCLAHAHDLQLNIELHAWDGEWYRRAYFDNGEPLGSKINQECCIDSLPQSWSVISGAGNLRRTVQAMDQVNKQLVNRNDNLIQLFTPPFDKSILNPGYIKGYVPGVRENGGQYTHGAIWAAMAFALMGQTERSWELFGLLNPVQHGKTAEQIAIYKVEPYVVAADVYACAPHTGRGGWTWYTGSSSWMYRLLVEMLLGVNRLGNKLNLLPLLPQNWNSYKVHYRFGKTVYHITFNRITDDSLSRLILDGKELSEKTVLPLEDDLKEHFVEMWL
ncbi:GH36-type glycosyl hydrolase domain-containing protein [uncultured Bacteroides sp.]|uniref:GH36-type glycosyl hydrolase domain-containing protein n=1 Tax=uncultured Bacteroides sp. TaxID=162156 RepID=UPI002AAB5BAA|nr:glucoamylase family protein [uncultured Bacteroides sp.]